MRIGLIARADNSGLGMQTWEFYNHMKPSKTLVVDMSDHNGNKIYPERYPTNSEFVRGIPTVGDVNEFLADLDVVFVAEAPYNYYLYQRAMELGVKTAVQYNYEFFDWFTYPHFPKPDMLIAPSRWNYNIVQKWADEHGVKHTYLHVPVDRVKLPFREIRSFKHFIHLVGRAAAHDRNGTLTLIDAAQHIKNECVIKIHFQAEQGIGHQVTHTFDDYFEYFNKHDRSGKIVMQQQEYDDYKDVWRDYDALVLPRRYGGNCLPMNEALSQGMPVIMTDISPNNQFLDNTWLVPARRVGRFEPRTVIDIYEADPLALAAKIDEFAAMPEGQAHAHNLIADALAQRIDWSSMRSEYIRVLEDLCKNRL